MFILKMVSEKEFEMMKDAGFEIEKFEDKESSIRVIVRYPDKDMTRKSFHYKKNDRWMKDVKYIEDGEVREKPAWLLDIENKIEKQLKNSEDYEFEDLESKTLDF